MEAPFPIFQKVPVANELVLSFWGMKKSGFSSQREGCRSGFPGDGMSASGSNDSHPETKNSPKLLRKGRWGTATAQVWPSAAFVSLFKDKKKMNSRRSDQKGNIKVKATAGSCTLP